MSADHEQDSHVDDPRDPDERQQAWDADDPRRRHDPMAPPLEPCECYCLHCGRAFMSDQMWFQRVIGDKSGFEGFWMCPTPNCDGAGFTFDIFPTDPDHPANEGWVSFDDDEEYDEDVEFDEEGNPIDAYEQAEYDPEETQYEEMDAASAAAGDIEGEEWKHGLAPGEQPPEPDWHKEARERMEEEEKRYDMPDERPRELDWSDREDREPRSFNDDDIPF